jgi:L-alanine-DL-glutamate epimerase-like enolase superfamily enzyme
MRIEAIRTWFEPLALSRPYTIAFRTVSSVRLGFVAIHGDDGEVGLGCASPEPHVTGETQQACEAALDAAALAWLHGRDVRTLPALCRELAARLPAAPAARAALDMALHDLLARRLGVPLVEMLGRAHEGLPTSITIGIKPTAEALEEADEYLARGFRVLKVKLGHALGEDLERLRALRGRIGPDIAIRVDPNQGYDSREVATFAESTADLGIEFLEQPMPAGEVDAMRALPAALRDRVAADESLLDEADALALASPPRACGVFNIKLMKCGGLRPALRIADVAETAGIELMWGCMDESVVGIAAALHAALACPATRYLDLDGSLDLARDVATGGFRIEDGVMRTIDAPGLGLTLEETGQ